MYASTSSDAAHTALPAADTLSYVLGGVSDARFNEITRWIKSKSYSAGKYASRDSDFKAIKKKLRADKAGPDTHELADLEVFEFYGDYFRNDDTEAIAGTRMEELSSRRLRHWAYTSWPDVTVGRSFKFKGDPNEADDGEYLIATCSFVVSHPGYEGLQVREEQIPVSKVLSSELADDPVNADFRHEWLQQMDDIPALRTGLLGSRAFLITALPANEPYRVPRLTPRVTMPGPQSGIVVGPDGEEIHADEFGRVKVHFHWDRYDESNEKSTAWVRVSQPWAGKGWGGYFIPRIGQEVIVDFLNGDPDRPIIMGRVYNDDQRIPFESHTQSGFRTRSTPGGNSANCNEFRFDDKKGAEQVYLHAEKNQDISVENDETHTVGHDRTKTIDHDETTTVKNDRTETVGNNEKISIGVDRSETVGSNETIAIGSNRTETVGVNESITIGSNRTIAVGANETATVAMQRTHTVGINETIAIGAAQEVAIGAFQSVNVGANQDIEVGINQSTSVGANQSIEVGSNRAIEVGTNLSTKVGGAESRTISKDRTTTISGGDNLKISKKLVIDAGDSISIKTGSASINMKSDGTIIIEGKDITIKASGKINEKASGDIVMKGAKILQN
jgi:type VI secretion system secreted protein VgrG